jgi:hypothetical protein
VVPKPGFRSDFVGRSDPTRSDRARYRIHRPGAATQQKKHVSSKFQILLKNVYIFNHLKTLLIISVFPRFVTALRQTSFADLKINLKLTLKNNFNIYLNLNKNDTTFSAIFVSDLKTVDLLTTFDESHIVHQKHRSHWLKHKINSNQSAFNQFYSTVEIS